MKSHFIKTVFFAVSILCGLLVIGWKNDKQQVPSFTFVRDLVVPNLHLVCTDNLGQVFTANTSNDLVKYDKEFKVLATANYKSLGPIRNVDVSNPFEIYVFFKEQNKVLYFDNLLNVKGQTDLEEGGYFLLNTVARSFDNKLWIFDLNDLKLKKIRKDLSVELSSGNVREFAKNENFNPEYIAELNKQVVLFNKNSGLYLFDNFANFQRFVPLPSAEQVAVWQGRLYYLEKNKIYELEMEILKIQEIPIQGIDRKMEEFSLGNGVLYTQLSDTISMFHWKK
jgi:DNA-dependent RNA polymerase auxiliary subunit epsilon